MLTVFIQVTHEFHVNYDSDLPEFKTKGGVHRAIDGSPQTVTSPPQLWLAAVDRLLADMQKAKFPFGRVVALSGSGQQHGSVYWKQGAAALLKNLDPAKVPTLLAIMCSPRSHPCAAAS